MYSIAIKGGVCRSHGAMRKLCSQDECTNQARAGGVCTRHGAQRKSCSHQDVPTKSGQEGFVLSMVPRSATRDAVMKDVPTMLRIEEYVSDMEQMLRLAVTKDVPTKLSREESRHGQMGIYCTVP